MSVKVAERLPEQFRQAAAETVRNLMTSKSVEGLVVGASAPDFTLPDATGKEVTLSQVLAAGPVVLSFYRGSWWPFCILELRELHGILPELKQADASLLAISPEKPDNTLSMIEKHNLPFPVLTDLQGDVMRSYEIAFEIPDNLREQYLKVLKRDFDLVNSGSGWFLPVPATFLIDQKGIIRYSYVNADYTKRLEPTQILELLKSHPLD
jgi:peroxiredoxin